MQVNTTEGASKPESSRVGWRLRFGASVLTTRRFWANAVEAAECPLRSVAEASARSRGGPLSALSGRPGPDSDASGLPLTGLPAWPRGMPESGGFQSFVGTHANGEVAPNSVVRGTSIELWESTEIRPPGCRRFRCAASRNQSRSFTQRPVGHSRRFPGCQP